MMSVRYCVIVFSFLVVVYEYDYSQLGLLDKDYITKGRPWNIAFQCSKYITR